MTSRIACSSTNLREGQNPLWYKNWKLNTDLVCSCDQIQQPVTLEQLWNPGLIVQDAHRGRILDQSHLGAHQTVKHARYKMLLVKIKMRPTITWRWPNGFRVILFNHAIDAWLSLVWWNGSITVESVVTYFASHAPIILSTFAAMPISVSKYAMAVRLT